MIFKGVKLFYLLMFLFLNFILYDYEVKIATEVNGSGLVGLSGSYMKFPYYRPIESSQCRSERLQGYMMKVVFRRY